MSTKVSFSGTNPGFSAALRQRVDNYFAQMGITPRGNWKLYLKTAVLVAVTSSAYVLLLFGSLPVWVSIILCVVLGAGLAGIGFNVMHDGAHGSYSGRQWVNDIMGHSLDLMGGSAFLWKQKHNVIHHTFTNVDGVDDDIDIKPWIRTNNNQPRKWFHRYQHIYWTVLYGMTYLIWVFQKDFSKYFAGKIGDIKIKKMAPKEHVIFWTSKALYFFLYLVLPIMMLGFWKTVIGYLIVAGVCGWILAVVFQLAHVVEEAEFPLPVMPANQIEEEWTIHQLKTTANFGTRSKVLSWFAGGLNFQIEHHLFPKISHIHYPEISKVVKQVCAEYGVPYLEHKTMWGALKSHVRHLRMAGVAG
jgi:linoleoyl-CoA desaturase